MRRNLNKRLLGLLMAVVMIFSNMLGSILASEGDMNADNNGDDIIIAQSDDVILNDTALVPTNIDDESLESVLEGDLFGTVYDYIVIWNAGEGAFSSELSDDPTVFSEEYSEGESLRPFAEQGLVAPDNKIFKGWSTDGTEKGIIDFEEYWDEEGGCYNYSVTSDIAFTAVWGSLYTVTWDAGEGEISNKYSEDPDKYIEAYSEGESINPFSELRLIIPENMMFKGWSVDGTEEGIVDFEKYRVESAEGSFYEYPVCGNMTFTAIWVSLNSDEPVYKAQFYADAFILPDVSSQILYEEASEETIFTASNEMSSKAKILEKTLALFENYTFHCYLDTDYDALPKIADFRLIGEQRDYLYIKTVNAVRMAKDEYPFGAHYMYQYDVAITLIPQKIGYCQCELLFDPIEAIVDVDPLELQIQIVDRNDGEIVPSLSFLLEDELAEYGISIKTYCFTGGTIEVFLRYVGPIGEKPAVTIEGKRREIATVTSIMETDVIPKLFTDRDEYVWRITIEGRAAGSTDIVASIGDKVNCSIPVSVEDFNISVIQNNSVLSSADKYRKAVIDDQAFDISNITVSNESLLYSKYLQLSSAINEYYRMLNQIIDAEAKGMGYVESIRAFDESQDQPTLIHTCDNNAVINAAYSGLTRIFDNIKMKEPSIDEIHLDSSLITIEREIIKKIAATVLDYTDSFTYNNFSVEVSVDGYADSFMGYINVSASGMSPVKFTLCSNQESTFTTMGKYLQSLNETVEDMIREGLKEYMKVWYHATGISDFSKEFFEEYMGRIYDYVKGKGLGTLSKYALNFYDICSSTKKLSSLFHNRSDFLKAFSDARGLYDTIHSYDFTDNTIKDIIIKRAMKTIQDKLEELDLALYNYVYHPDDDLEKKRHFWDNLNDVVFKKTTAHCPVDLYIYNEAGEQIGYATDNYCHFEAPIYIVVENDVKTVYSPDSTEICIIMIGTGNGTLSYSIEEYDEIGISNRINYYDMQLDKDSIYAQVINTGKIDKNMIPSVQDIQNNSYVQAMEYIEADRSNYNEINCNIEGEGNVIGSGSFLSGDTAVLTAIPFDGNVFVGWYEDGVLLQEGNVSLIFDVSHERTITARFAESSTINEDVDFSAYEDIIAGGKCGSIVWQIRNDGALLVIGTGEISGFSNLGLNSSTAWGKGEKAPWLVFSDQIKKVSISKGIIKIGKGAFNGLEVSELTLPDSLREIEKYAFSWIECDRLQIPDGVITIGADSFARSKIATIIVGNGLKTISAEAFHCITSDSLIMENGVIAIEGNAFLNSAIKTISIPASVKTIESNAFYGCSALNTVYYDGSESQWKQIAGVDEAFDSTITLGGKISIVFTEPNHSDKIETRPNNGNQQNKGNQSEDKRKPDGGQVSVTTQNEVQEVITINKSPASVKAKAKKNKVTVSWNKIKKNKKTKALRAMIKNVEVQYSTDPSFTEETTDSRIIGENKTKYVIRGLQRKTMYYIRVRYVGADGVSNWKTKRVRTK